MVLIPLLVYLGTSTQVATVIGAIAETGMTVALLAN